MTVLKLTDAQLRWVAGGYLAMCERLGLAPADVTYWATITYGRWQGPYTRRTAIAHGRLNALRDVGAVEKRKDTDRSVTWRITDDGKEAKYR